MDIDIKYQEALDYLYSFIDYSLTRSFRYTPDKFNLDRMYSLMKALGNPQLNYPVIHVAGTKGKGSVSAMCAAVLKNEGYDVGLYTSPHLQEYNERIQVNGIQITKNEFVDLVDEIKPYASKIKKITTFELTTALGFLYFARKQVDIAVLEVGLGGRLDATNIVIPLVSVITALSYDHIKVLGNTLAKIASEKAGIIKSGRPVVCAPQKEEAWAIIDRIAAERNAPLYKIGREFLYEPVKHSIEQQSFRVWRVKEEPVQLNIPLLGLHQVENAVTAYAALQIASQNGLFLSARAINSGFASVSWPGRFEILNENPVVVIDSAHNPDSAERLRQALDDYFPGKNIIMLFGASEDKDISGMYKALLPRIHQVIATQSVHPRAMNADLLADMAGKFNCRSTISIPVEKALENALAAAGPEDVILATGSLFVAAAVREIWFSPKLKGLHVSGAIPGKNRVKIADEK